LAHCEYGMLMLTLWKLSLPRPALGGRRWEAVREAVLGEADTCGGCRRSLMKVGHGHGCAGHTPVCADADGCLRWCGWTMRKAHKDDGGGAALMLFGRVMRLLAMVGCTAAEVNMCVPMTMLM